MAADQDQARSRADRIEAALAKRNFSSSLAPRIERLLSGAEDRGKLRCCNSGCFVCVHELLAILDEVEAGGGAPVSG
jgi:hypothetical protein